MRVAWIGLGNMGLLNINFTPKPAFSVLTNLLAH